MLARRFYAEKRPVTIMRAETSDHSGKPLVDKLGIKEGFRIIILNPPGNFREILGELPKNVTIMNRRKGPLDFIHFFTKKQRELQDRFPILKRERTKWSTLDLLAKKPFKNGSRPQ